MDFHIVVPRINVSDSTIVVCKIPRWAEKDASQMHKFAEGEVSKKDTDEEKMYEEDDADPIRNSGMKAGQSHCQFFHLYNIHFDKVPHDNPREGYMPMIKNNGKKSAARDIYRTCGLKTLLRKR